MIRSVQMGEELELESAPRVRRMLAGLIDAAVLGAPPALLSLSKRKAAGPDRSPALERRERARAHALHAGGLLLEQQLCTPGEWIMKLRTVDRRTGRRLPLRASIAYVLATALAQALRDLVAASNARATQAEREERKRRMQALGEQVRAIHERYPEGSQARSEAIRSLYREQPPMQVSCWRPLLSAAAFSLVNHRLQRYLAPTVVVDAEHVCAAGELRWRAPALTARRSGRSPRA